LQHELQHDHHHHRRHAVPVERRRSGVKMVLILHRSSSTAIPMLRCELLDTASIQTYLTIRNNHFSGQAGGALSRIPIVSNNDPQFVSRPIRHKLYDTVRSHCRPARKRPVPITTDNVRVALCPTFAAVTVADV
jgi:hypothetical protein